MENEQTYKLIEGIFEPDQANNIVMALMNYKINYHRIEMFSMDERGMGDPAYSQRRIDELKKAIAHAKEMIHEAAEKGIKLRVKSSIEMVIIK